MKDIKLPDVKGEYRFNTPISNYCWFGVGGNASVFYKPSDIDDLSHFIKHKESNLNHLVIGVGSNLLVNDSGFHGAVIKLGRSFNFINDLGDVLEVGASTLDLNVALYSAENSISGLEFLSGIPGTIGGALAMNAGAYGKEIKDVVESITYINELGDIVTISSDKMGFEYRKNNIDNRFVFVKATLKKQSGSQAIIKQQIQEIQNARKSTQPVNTKTGGSTFKNPENHKAWKLIEDAGLRGYRIGGAKFSELHCNFIINDNNAKASDILDLIELAKKRVYESSGIMLESEIKVL